MDTKENNNDCDSSANNNSGADNGNMTACDRRGSTAANTNTNTPVTTTTTTTTTGTAATATNDDDDDDLDTGFLNASDLYGMSSDQHHHHDHHRIAPNGMSWTTKYKHGLQHSIPIRCERTPKDTLPLDTLGFINYVTFGWLTCHLWAVYRRGADAVSHLSITRTESAEFNAIRMERLWRDELEKKGAEKASVASAIFRAFRTRFIIGSLVNIVGTLLTMANPIFVIHYFLDYLTTQEVTLSTGVCYVILLSVFVVLRGLCGSFCWMLHNEAATRIKSGTQAAIYRKILSLKSLGDKSVGDLVNLFSLDGQCIWDGVTNSPLLVSGALGLLISCGYALYFLGPWALMAWLVIIAFPVLQGALAKRSMAYRNQSIGITDQRVGLLSELLNNMSFIKFNAWEKPLGQKIRDLRCQERSILEKSVFTMSVSMGSAMLVPLVASCLTFIGYVASGNDLTAKQAFTFISLMNTMQISLATTPFALKSLSDMLVSARRIKEVFMMEEMSHSSSSQCTSSPSVVLEMNKARLTWSQRRKILADSGAKSEKSTRQNKRKRRNNNNKEKSKKNQHHNVKDVNGSEVEEDSDKEKLTAGSSDDGRGSIYTGPVLKDITFTLHRGNLLGVCGQVGSGKSTLLSAILGRMHTMAGSISVSARMAYVPQQAWITSDSIRDNILFGHDYDEDRYKQVIQVCALQQDLNSLPKGDHTEVGERGTTLSGGQKQRVSLARAAYSTSDTVLLDDPLSAVDVHVSRHIFEQCIMGWMKGRSLVFVTHQLQYLKRCDQILVMQDGQAVECGSHQELLSVGGSYVNLINVYRQQQLQQQKDGRKKEDREEKEEVEDKEGEEANVSMEKGDSGIGMGDGLLGEHSVNNGKMTDDWQQKKSFVSDVKTVTGGNNHTTTNHIHTNKQDSHRTTELSSLIQKEVLENSVSLSVVDTYIRSVGGYLVCGLVLVSFVGPVLVMTATNWFVSYWIHQGGGGANITVNNVTVPSQSMSDNPRKDEYLTIYGCFLPAVVLAMLVRSFATAKAGLSASSHIHGKALQWLLRQPFTFFLSTPVGRIINRFSTDLDEIDNRLPMHLELFLLNLLQVLAALGVMGYVCPWFLLGAAPCGLLFWMVLSLFHSCFHKLKCLDNVTRSPLVSHLAASVHGLACIHAYGKTRQFFYKYCRLLDSNSMAVFLYYSTNRWLALRLDVISAIVLFLTGILILVTFNLLNPALAGLALAYAIQISGLFQFSVRLAMETEARFSSVQRLQEYCGGKTPNTEHSGKEDSNPNHPAIQSPAPIPSPPVLDWPKEGHVSFSKVTLCYRHGLAPALKNVTFDVKAGEKVGIVGRTGAGKSSLCTALFRMYDLDQGRITIDDLDITKVDIGVLRSRLSIVPQDPVLLAGTIRYNLDPFHQHSDDKLWQALQQCHAADLVKSLEHRLDSTVQENGSNFSIGEKQLLCLARVFLKQNRVLVLDEATASVDSETHALVQQTLREAFAHVTMLVIAHRLHSVTGLDKVLVMEEGEVVECDSPSNLLGNAHSKFAAMMSVKEEGKGHHGS